MAHEPKSLFASLSGFVAWARADDTPTADWMIERKDAARIVDALTAAQSVYLGFTCKFDPMDVDERLERLGEALGLPAPTGESQGMGG